MEKRSIRPQTWAGLALIGVSLLWLGRGAVSKVQRCLDAAGTGDACRRVGDSMALLSGFMIALAVAAPIALYLLMARGKPD